MRSTVNVLNVDRKHLPKLDMRWHTIAGVISVRASDVTASGSFIGDRVSVWAPRNQLTLALRIVLSMIYHNGEVKAWGEEEGLEGFQRLCIQFASEVILCLL